MFFKKRVRVVIKNQNMVVETKSGSNLYQLLIDENIILPTLCRGSGQCGKCKVHISMNNLPKPTKKEQLVLASSNLNAGYRLACQTVVRADMVVDTSEVIHSPFPSELNMHMKAIVRPTIPTINQLEELITTPQGGDRAKQLANEDIDSDEWEKNIAQSAPVKDKSDNKTSKEENLAANASHTEVLDGLLIVHQKNKVRYLLYSAAIDAISQEGSIDTPTDLQEYIDSGMISDYVHDVLKIKDIDRMIILSDEPSSDGENLFDMVSYKPFDIGAMPCELIRPLPHIENLSLFYRLLSVKGKQKLLISLDKLDNTYYYAQDAIVKVPVHTHDAPRNMFDLATHGKHPVAEISDDLRVVSTGVSYIAPDSLPLPMLLRAVALMLKHKVVDMNLNILDRGAVAPDVPLDYVVKILRTENQGNSFHLYRNKDDVLLITQEMLSQIRLVRKHIHNTIDFVLKNLGKVDAIIISTEKPINGLLNNIIELSLVPKMYENITLTNSGDSPVIAVKLFQEQDARTFVQKNFGGFYSPQG